MTTPRRRRWFHFAFSLRALFVVVTAAGCWLGWQLEQIHARKSFVKALRAAGVVVEYSDASVFYEQGDNVGKIVPPLFRRLLGDVWYYQVAFPESANDRMLIRRTRKLYPEARVLPDYANGRVPRWEGWEMDYAQ